MEINGRITILTSETEVMIEINDADASVNFVRVTLSPDQFTQALSRLMYTHTTKTEVYGLEKVGKKMEIDHLEFPLSITSYNRNELEDAAKAEVHKFCPEGWTPQLHFGSKRAFIRRDGIEYAQCTIKRWVTK